MSEAASSRQLTDRDQRFATALQLTELGKFEEAKQAYLDLLEVDPIHFGALNNLGNVLCKIGQRRAAIQAFFEVVRLFPLNPLGHINLANILVLARDLEQAREHYETALRIAPTHPGAHEGLANVLEKMGDLTQANFHREQSLYHQAVRVIPYLGQPDPIRLLIFVSVAEGNVPIGKFLDPCCFSATEILTELYNPATPLPAHDIVINAVSDADLCRSTLESVTTLLSQTSAPVINHPAAILPTGRVDIAKRLVEIPDLKIPKTETFPRESFLQEGAEEMLHKHGFCFPLLLRTPGAHTGHHFIKLECMEELVYRLVELPGDQLTAIEFLDARSVDGKIRKYRVMMIDRKLYPLHVAISRNWKIHFYTAEMENDADHRAEDQNFLNDMEGVLGSRAITALTQVCDRLGLDYAGADFSLGSDGQVLLFEANATMNVVGMEGEKWLYRKQPVEKITDAVLQMIRKQLTGELS